MIEPLLPRSGISPVKISPRGYAAGTMTRRDRIRYHKESVRYRVLMGALNESVEDLTTTVLSRKVEEETRTRHYRMREGNTTTCM